MKFALITEGVSEHRIIRYILLKYFENDDLIINQIQPKVVDKKQKTIGGWAEVLAYCQRPEIHDILIENDFLIVQIDSDQSQTSPFSVNYIDNHGAPKTPDQLLVDIIERLKALFIHEIFQAYQARIIFAICIHTIECWLLPVVFNDHRSNATSNCTDRLNRELARKNMDCIPAKGDSMRIQILDKVLHTWRRKKNVVDASQYNPGFRFFIESLEKQMGR